MSNALEAGIAAGAVIPVFLVLGIVACSKWRN
jgi:hypothetical protein